MRIGFSGVSSTGKSTLAREIARILDLPLLDEGMKDVFARRKEAGLITNHKWSDLPLDIKIDFQVDMIRHRSLKELSMRSFVGDGTPLDIKAFWLEWSTTHDARVSDEIMSEVDDVLDMSLKRYDIIFQLPFGVIPVEDDNRRITDLRFLGKINRILSSITDDYLFRSGTGPAIFKIREVPVGLRIAEIVAIIEGLKSDGNLNPLN